MGWVAKALPAVAEPGCWVTVSWEGPASATLKLFESAVVRAASAKWRVLAPVLSRRRFVKVATPLTAAIERVPWSGPVPEPSDALTVEVSPPTVLP